MKDIRNRHRRSYLKLKKKENMRREHYLCFWRFMSILRNICNSRFTCRGAGSVLTSCPSELNSSLEPTALLRCLEKRRKDEKDQRSRGVVAAAVC